MNITPREYYSTITAMALMGGLGAWGLFGPFEFAEVLGWSAIEALGSLLAAFGAFYAARTAISISTRGAAREAARDQEARLRAAHAVLIPVAQELVIVHHRLTLAEDHCKDIPEVYRAKIAAPVGLNVDDLIRYSILHTAVDQLTAPMCERFIDRFAGLDAKVGEAIGRAITMFVLLKSHKHPVLGDCRPDLVPWQFGAFMPQAMNVRDLIRKAIDLITPELESRGLVLPDYDPSVLTPPPSPVSP